MALLRHVTEYSGFAGAACLSSMARRREQVDVLA